MSSQEKKSMDKKSKIIVFGILVVLILLLIIGIGFCAKSNVSPGELSRRLKSEDTDTIEIDGTVEIDESLVVNGNKTIIGSGEIVLVSELDGDWQDDSKKNSWGMGCAKLDLAETDGMSAMLNLNNGAMLTLGESVTLNASEKGNVIHVAEDSELTLTDKATVKAGRYANVIVAEKGKTYLQGGSVKDSKTYGVINYGSLDISDGEHIGSEAVVYNVGITTQSGGTVSEAAVHNVYVAEGTFTMTGGVNEGATKDGIIVREDAIADIKDGEVKNCVHGLCNDGKLDAGKVELSECGIMNYKAGTLTLDGTTVDTAATYCLANNGGKVAAKNFTAKKCDTCAVYNFSGDMNLTYLTITGSRDGNISNGGGNLTVDGAKLEKCRDKSITVANGKAVFNDVTVEGTSREKYGVYVYGGECYITDGTFCDISSTAFKVDSGGYVEVKDIEVKDITENLFHADGGEIVAENVTTETIGSHAVYNMGGTITLTNATIKDVEKNVVQQKDGTTSIQKVNADKIGNNGAYVELGSLAIKDSAFKNMTGNGLYIIKGDNNTTLTKLTLEEVGKQGINNSSKVTIDGLTVKNAVENGIYNKETGILKAKNVNISGTGKHGISNHNKATVEQAKISDTGKGSNGLQNKGTLTIKEVTIKNSKNHGVYNEGTIKGSGLDIVTVTRNGVYNSKGKIEVTNISVDGTGEHGFSNQDKATVEQVKISDTGKDSNGLQNKGTLTINDVVVKNSKNHGVYNEGTIKGSGLDVVSVTRNGVYNSKGKIEVTNISVDGAGEHGFSNADKMIVSDVSINGTGSEKNSIQNTGSLKLTTAVLQNSENHGIFNTGTISGENINIFEVSKAGVYNTDGGIIDAIEGLVVDGTGSHGINNESKFVVSKLEVSNVGQGKNGVQNAGTAKITTATIADVQNHGVYNNGKFSGTDIAISGTIGCGFYNYGGVVDKITGLSVENAGSHGVSNAGSFSVASLNVLNTGHNGVQNSGNMTMSGVTLTNSVKHGLYNEDVVNGEDILITDAGDLSVNNTGDMVLHSLETNGKSNKAIYNSGYAEFYKTTVDGTNVDNRIDVLDQYLVDNNGGVLDLQDSTIKNAKGTALHNRGNAATSVTNVIIDKAGNYGVFVEEGSSLSGDGLEINNVVKNTEISGAEGIAIKNQGKITMSDHVTIGGKDSDVSGSGAPVSEDVSVVTDTAILVDSSLASYSGYDLKIQNVATANAIYNKGVVYVKDLKANNVRDVMVCRQDAWATLSGHIALKDTVRHAFYTYGPEELQYKNGITVATGTEILVDGVGNHAINNKGSFLAATDSNITIQNIVGSNLNAINNNTATMVLGNVSIKDMYVDISGTNVGNALYTSGSLTLNGPVEISNIYTKGSRTDSRGSAIVARGAKGAINGEGSIEILNGSSVNGYSGIYDGIYAENKKIVLAGDITVNGAENYGVFVYSNGGRVEGKNITISNTGDHGIWLNNGGGHLVASETLSVENVAGRGIYSRGVVNAKNIVVTNARNTGIETDRASQIICTEGITVNGGSSYGIRLDGQNSLVQSKNVTVNNAGNHAIWVSTPTDKLVATEKIDVNGGSQRGIYVYGTVEAKNVNIINTKAAGIRMDNDGAAPQVTVTENITINGNQSEQGILLSGADAILNAGDITIVNDGTKGTDAIRISKASGQVNVSGLISVDNVKEKGISTVGVINAKNVSITNTGKAAIEIEANAQLMATEDVVVSGNKSERSIYLSGAEAKLQARNITVAGTYNTNIEVAASSELTSTGTITITPGSGKRGLRNYGTVNAVNITLNTPSQANAIDNENGGSLTATGIISIMNPTNARGIYNKGYLEADQIIVENAVINTAKNNDCNVIQNNSGKTLLVRDVTISGITSSIDAENCANGISNAGTFRITGNATISNVVNQAQTNTYATDGNGIYNTGKIEPRVGNSGAYKGNVYVTDADNYGIYNTGSIKLNVCTLTNAELYNSGTFTKKN